MDRGDGGFFEVIHAFAFNIGHLAADHAAGPGSTGDHLDGVQHPVCGGVDAALGDEVKREGKQGVAG